MTQVCPGNRYRSCTGFQGNKVHLVETCSQYLSVCQSLALILICAGGKEEMLGLQLVLLLAVTFLAVISAGIKDVFPLKCLAVFCTTLSSTVILQVGYIRD